MGVDNPSDGQLEQARAEYRRLEQQAKTSVEEGRAGQVALMLRVLQFEFQQLEAIAGALSKGEPFDNEFLARILQQFLEKLDEAGMHHIGKVGEQVPFDLSKHRALASAGIIPPGTLVEIATSGYSFTDQDGEEQVSLPASVRPVSLK